MMMVLIDSVLNLNDDPNFETFFDPFGNVVGNDDSFKNEQY